MVYEINSLLEKYNLVNYDCDGDFEDYYMGVAETMEALIIDQKYITEEQVVEIFCNVLDVDEDEVNIDEINYMLDEIDE